jgi:hypothetical protein
MLSIYSFNRKTVLVGTMILASLTVAMTAQSAHAQNIAGVRRAVVSDGYGSRFFTIDSSGRMRAAGDSILEITRLGDDGSLNGKFYASGTRAPSSTNVTGSINIVSGTTSVWRISFIVSQASGPFANETAFDGAIRLGGPRELWFAFMAGTFTNTVSGGVSAASGPFPFCAKLTSLPG